MLKLAKSPASHRPSYNKSKSYGLEKSEDTMPNQPALTIRPARTSEDFYAANYNNDGCLIRRPPEPVDEFEPVSDDYWHFAVDEYHQIKRQETADYRLLVLPFKTEAVFVPKDCHFIGHDDPYVLREWLLRGQHSQAFSTTYDPVKRMT
jgi:hypothetical protein